jgi:asparagine synthase (glutamine-hydrolysing)
LLDGQGSDEYFCGYEEFFLVYIMQLLRKGKWLTAWKNLRHKASIQNIGITSQVKNFFRTAFWFPLIQFSKKLIGRTDFPWLIPAYSKIADAEQPSFVSTTIKELSVQQVLHTSLPYQLHSADRNSMIFSLEVREPFIDYRLVEYVLGLPDEFKIRNGYSKYILREAIDELPEQIRNRSHKMGFVAPDKKWVLENKEMIRNELEDAIKNTGFFTQALVERFDLFVSGKLGYEMCYLRAITFNRFCKIFNMDLS